MLHLQAHCVNRIIEKWIHWLEISSRYVTPWSYCSRITQLFQHSLQLCESCHGYLVFKFLFLAHIQQLNGGCSPWFHGLFEEFLLGDLLTSFIIYDSIDVFGTGAVFIAATVLARIAWIWYEKHSFSVDSVNRIVIVIISWTREINFIKSLER